jgi:hypothetical protein
MEKCEGKIEDNRKEGTEEGRWEQNTVCDCTENEETISHI